MLKRTALYQQHQLAGAKLVDFAGWEMPLHYGSQIEEHHAVRRNAGMFDVSHMAIVDIQGTDAGTFLRYLLANDVSRLKEPGKALYSCMLNEQGGIIDDLIVYFVAPNNYRLVVNAGTRAKDLAWIKQQAQNFVTTITERTDLAMLAIQGPLAREKVIQLFNENQRDAITTLKPFQFTKYNEWFIARTGYTGEDGFEIMLPATEATAFWQTLLNIEVSPCGLGARDTLRLEAGLNLYGVDMDETVTPLESNLTWTVMFEPHDRNFLGRKALEDQQKQGIPRKLVGLVLEERGVLRNHQHVTVESAGEGEITSGSFSPTLGFSVALARIPANIDTTHCHVAIRDKLVPARIVKPPFVRNGKKVF